MVLRQKVQTVRSWCKMLIAGTQCNCDSHLPSLDDPMRHLQYRDSEIQLYNSSIHFINTPPDMLNATLADSSSASSPQPEQRVFTYYWRVRDMATKLSRWEPRRSIRSPSFYISPSGYKMYIRLYPRQNGKNIYLHVGLTKGEYDALLDWPFRLKHRISVLDQREDNIQDIHSRIWNPTVLCSGYNWKRPTVGDNYECVGLGFPQEVLKSRDYILDNTIVIKLTVYLDA
jgi:hypothetical protein